MLLNATCKAGRLQVSEDGIICVQAPFSKLVWQEPCQNVTGITAQPVGLAYTVIISTTTSTYTIELMTKANVEKLQSLFPNINAHNASRATHWYQDVTKRTHVATYTNQKVMQKEVEQAAQHGWIPQTSAGISGHVSATKIIAGGMLLGGVGALLGSGRSKDKITVTFVRSPEWLATNR